MFGHNRPSTCEWNLLRALSFVKINRKRMTDGTWTCRVEKRISRAQSRNKTRLSNTKLTVKHMHIECLTKVFRTLISTKTTLLLKNSENSYHKSIRKKKLDI